jgi:competence ComEA-like helix-hairpin-helix protein
MNVADQNDAGPHDSLDDGSDNARVISDPPLPHATPADLLGRYRLLLRPEHQPALALVILLCALFMAGYFFYKSTAVGGIFDIDDTASRHADFKIDVNTAEWPELVAITGIGEKMAQAIVAYRQQHGPFASPDAITAVPGIGESKLQEMKPYLMPIAVPIPRSSESSSTLPTSERALQ